eukprot:240847_1
MRPITGKAGLSVPGAYNVPPGMRPPTSQAAMYGMGSRAGGRPGSALRRVGTPGNTPMAVGTPVGLETNMRVDVRPVTQHGITGMQSRAGVGPGRRIADKSYYLNELRSRVESVHSEIQRLQGELEGKNERAQRVRIRCGIRNFRCQLPMFSVSTCPLPVVLQRDIVCLLPASVYLNCKERDDSMIEQLERRRSESDAEVKELHNRLEDYNVAFDQLRRNADIRDLEADLEELEVTNKQESELVDSVFLDRSNTEKLLSDVGAQIDELHAEAENRMSELDDDLYDEYRSLQSESTELAEGIRSMEDEIQSGQMKYDQAQREVQNDSYRVHMQGVEFKRELEDLIQQISVLEEETDGSLTVDDMRERIIAQVKQDKAATDSIEKEIAQTEDDIDSMQDRAREKEREVEEMKEYAAQAHKYEALFERDRKIQLFIDAYPESKALADKEKSECQVMTKKLLEHISKGMHKSDHVPDKDKFEEMKDDLSFKQRQTDNAASTMTHLNMDLQKRKDELKKVETLDQKIGKELEVLKIKMEKMTSQMGSFDGVDQLKTNAEDKKQFLMKEQQRIQQQRNALKHQVQAISNELGEKKKQLETNNIWKSMDTLEQKLRTYLQTEFALQEYIDSKKRSSDYGSIASDVKSLTSQINEKLIKNAAKYRPSASPFQA